MTVEVVVVPNALEPLTTETQHVPELVPWLVERFGRWPATARLYHRAGNAEYDVTPEVAADVAALSDLTGTFVVRVYPEGIDPISLSVGIVYGAIKLLDWILPDVPNIKVPAQHAGFDAGSPNNKLGKPSNEARPNQRIPYIMGGVRSVPDLLMVPYSTYVDHVEVESAYFCIGVGDYTVSSIRDGDTLISQIDGASAQVYGPGKAPTGGFAEHDPHTTVGEDIEDDVYTVYQVESVNGQELHGFSDFTFYGSAFPQNGSGALLNRFLYSGGGAGIVSVPYTSSPDEITDRVEVGDQLFVNWPMDFIPAGIGTAPDLNTPVTSSAGEPVVVTALTVTSIDDSDTDVALVHIGVTVPVSQRAQWELLETYFDPSPFPYLGGSFAHAQVTNLRELYAGPFFIDFEHPGGADDLEIVCNFVAPRGLFSDDGVTTRPLDIEIQVILTPADASGIPIGDPEAFQGTLDGSATARGARALTLRCKPVGFGSTTRCLVQARRLTNTPRRQRQTDEVEEEMFSADLDADPPRLAYFSGQVTDEVRWTHCYSMSKPGNISFGNVTTIHTRTVATTGALRVKNRQLNCFAGRKIQTWDGSSFGGTAVYNDVTENVLFTIMKDATIGNLDDANIDFEGIAAACQAVRDSVWSDSDLATRFNFTFDDADVSFEETLQAICQSAFLTPYRDGNVIKVRPEIAGDDSLLVLNHRNVLSRSMRITHTFGEPTENDSVEVGYVDPNDDANTKVTVPKFGSRLRPKQVKVVGLRDSIQAYWHAYRALHKMRYQRQNLTLEATQEAAILGARERVLIADETRAGTQTGELVGWDEAETVRTSQPVVLEGGRSYTLHLQNADGTVASYTVDSSPSKREITLTETPSPDPITDPSFGVRTLYTLMPNDQPTPSAFLVSSVRPTTPMTHQVEAVNYSHLYYLADGLTTWVDFANGLSDLSPVQRAFTNNGGTITGGQWIGEFGDYFDAIIVDVPDTTTPSYTKVLWLTATLPTAARLIETTDNSEQFQITFEGLLIAGHGGSFPVNADFTAAIGSEHMASVTYDAETERMALHIDGALVDEATVSAAVPGSTLRYLEDYEGSCRWLAKWGRALSDREIMEIYLRTRL